MTGLPADSQDRRINGHSYDYASASQKTLYARTYLRAAIDETTDRLFITSFENFPRPKIGEIFLVTLDDGTDFEVVKVYKADARTFYVERGQERTTPKAWPAGTLVENRVSMDTLYSFNQGYSFDMARLFNRFMDEPIYVYEDPESPEDTPDDLPEFEIDPTP